MKTKDIIKAIEPYCDRIVLGGSGHYKAYVKGTNKVVTISSTSYGHMAHKEVFRDFRRLGVIIDALNKY